MPKSRDPEPANRSILGSVGGFCVRHRKLVASVWLAVVVFGLLAAGGVFSRLTDANNPDLESVRGFEMLEDARPYGEQFVALVDVVPADDAEVRAAVGEATERVRAVPGVSEVVSAYDPQGQALRSSDGAASAVLVSLDKFPETDGGVHPDQQAALDEAKEHLEGIEEQVPGTRVRFGGGPFVEQESDEQFAADTVNGELIALPVSLAVLVVVFGGFVAAAVPVIGTIVAVAGTLLVLLGFSYVLDMDSNVVTVVTVLSFGLSIDYGLLLVGRFREERARGLDVAGAVARTSATAGRTVAFSGLTVSVSLAGLLLFENPFYRSMGAAGIAVVLVAMVATLTLTPALLGMIGGRIHVGGRRGIRGLFFARLARAVARRPLPVALGAGALLASFGLPFIGVQLQNGGADLLPESFESRQVADVLADRFPGQGTDPLWVVARTDAAELKVYAAQVRRDPRVAHARAGTGGGGTSYVEITPRGEGQGEQAQELVRDLRDDEPGFRTWVTGEAAVLVDLKDEISDRGPLVAGFIAAASAVLLFALTGSVLIPLKALVMNVLSLGASFGALVLVFQDGHLSGLLGFTPPGALETWIPVLVFIFAFGLSMDYEVFLLSRIKEMRDAGHSNERAVELGLQHSGGIITAAAVLTVIAFAGFAGGEMINIKQLGLAIALAVFLDATVVRCLLVPATMTLLGQANWWAPWPLRALHRRFGFSESPPGEQAEPGPPPLLRVTAGPAYPGDPVRPPAHAASRGAGQPVRPDGEDDWDAWLEEARSMAASPAPGRPGG